MRKTTIVLLLTAIISLVYFNVSAWQYHTIRVQGKVVYLELRPVDPISLVQGQYMTVDFALERLDIDPDLLDSNILQNNPPTDLLAVLKLDENSVGNFVTLISESDLESWMSQHKTDPDIHREPASELPHDYAVIQVGLQSNGLRIKLRQNSFLFQENTQSRYSSARYGVFHVQKNGRYVLVDLADSSLQSLTPPMK